MGISKARNDRYATFWEWRSYQYTAYFQADVCLEENNDGLLGY